jgi:hypothetical protein
MPKAEDPDRSPAETLRAPRRDLGDIAGSWIDDPAFDVALAEQDTIWQTLDNDECDGTAGKASS